MVIYHPAYDVHHCTYRLLHVLCSTDSEYVPRDALRLIDFYYVYPHLLKYVQLPKQFSRFSKVISNVSDPFEITPNPKALFFDLSRIHESALGALVQRSIVSASSVSVSLNLDPLPDSLLQAFGRNHFSESDFFKCLISVFPTLKLEGRGGFKDRCGLMEYRYD